MNKKTESKQSIFVVLTILLSLLFSLALAEWVLSYQRKSIENSEHMDAGMILYDAGLGWRLKPYWSGKHHHYDYDASYTINAAGFRGHLLSNTEKNRQPFSIVGDSFSFGLGVDENQTFTALMDSNSSDSFYNFSVPGYSTDQQLLLIKKLSGEISNNVILVVYLGNDVFDNMLSFPLQAEHGKPYFTLHDKSLSLQNAPVPLTHKDAAARNISISSLVLGADYNNKNTVSSYLSSFEISRRLALFTPDVQLSEQLLNSRFTSSLELLNTIVFDINDVMKNRQGELSVVLLPGRSYVMAPTSYSAQYQEYFRAVIKASLDKDKTIKVLDLAMYLRQVSSNRISFNEEVEQLYFPNEGHLTPAGHKVVAEFLQSRL